MNRKNLTAAVLAGLAGAAGIAGTAQAVNLNPDGLGQVLVYPYYTTRDGNDTLLSVVNTTDSAKAVKVRFKEGYNSREVLDFNMYMSAYDVWVAAIADDAGTPTLFIPDTTCTVPYLYGDGVEAGLGMGVQEFLPYDYTGDFEDGGPTDIGRAAEGHFEIIEMGTLTNDTETAKRLGSADAATHIYDDGEQVPADCYQLVDNWTEFASGPDGMWIDDEDLDITRNSGGLFGGAAIVNVGKGTMHAYDAKAIQGYSKAPNGNHFRPGNSNPSLNDGTENTAVVFFGVPQDRAVSLHYYRSIDAISAVFMHEYIMNEYNIESGLNAASEWVVTFPTKNYYVDPLTGGTLEEEIWIPDETDPGCGGWTQGSGEPYPTRYGPFGDETGWELCTYVDIGGDFGRNPFTSVFDGEACEFFDLEIWDREENAGPDTPGNDRPPIVSPAPPGGSTPPGAPFELCYEVNILRFGDNPVFGSDLVEDGGLAYTIGNAAQAGWARIDMGADPEHQDSNGLVGLPVTGFWAVQYENGFLGTPEASVLANYGGMFDHKSNVRRKSLRDQ